MVTTDGGLTSIYHAYEVLSPSIIHLTSIYHASISFARTRGTVADLIFLESPRAGAAAW